MRLERIVVGVDGSANSDRAANAAATLAELSGAEIIAVHAIGLLEGSGRDRGSLIERRIELRHALEHEWTALLRRPDLVVRCELVDGSPAEALVRTIDAVGADLVVVGSRGVGTVPTQLLGSTSAQLAIDTPCPILVVPDRHVER